MLLAVIALFIACSGDEPAGGGRDAGPARDAFIDLDSSGRSAACVERARACSRTPIIGPEGRCMYPDRRECVLAAETCAEVAPCGLGPNVDSGVDAGPVDAGPPIDPRCYLACYDCGYDYANDTGRSVDVCTGHCTEAPTRDCILAATTCEAMDACVPP